MEKINGALKKATAAPAPLEGLTPIEKDILFNLSGTAEKYQLTDKAITARRYVIKQKLKKYNISMEQAKKLPVLSVAAATDKPPVTIKKSSWLSNDADFDTLFTMEPTPPPLPITSDLVKLKVIEKIKELAKDCPVNGAILIPATFKVLALRLLKKEMGAMKWKAMPIQGTPTQIRIYKLSYPEKKIKGKHKL
jgi:hypothetical protein